MPSGKYLTLEQQQEIVRRYSQEKVSHQKLGESLGLSAICVGKVLRKHGVKGKTNAFSIDENFFEKIDTPQKAYFLGWILSDGCCFSDSNHIAISVTESDKEILEKLRNLIKFEGSVKTYDKKDSFSTKRVSVLSFCNKKIKEDISKHECSPTKTFTLKFPQIEQRLLSHFLRGFIEGDGHLGVTAKNQKFFVGLLATHDFMFGVKKILKEQLGIDIVLGKTPYPWMSRFQKGKRQDVVNILDWIYKDCEDMFLPRKYEIYKRIKQIHETKPLKRKEWTHRKDGRPRKGTPLGPRRRSETIAVNPLKG